MTRYFILNRIPSSTLQRRQRRNIEHSKIAQAIALKCPGVVWKGRSYLSGKYNALDIIEAESQKELDKVINILRKSYG